MIRDMNVKAAYDVNIESPWEISVFFLKKHDFGSYYDGERPINAS